MDPEKLSNEARTAYADGRISEAIDLQSRAVRMLRRANQFNLQDHLRLTVYLTAAGQIGRAKTFLDQIRHQAKGDFDYHLNLARLHMKQGDDEEALTELLAARKIDHDQPSVNDSLAIVLGRLNRVDESVKCGEVALLLRSRIASAMPVDFRLPEEDPPAFDAGNPGRNIIVFTLPTSDEYLVKGAVQNATFARAIYPGWRCRFYVASDFPADKQKRLLATGAQIVQVSGRGRLKEPQLWGLHVLGDKKVQYFLMRDVRALLNVRERVAVDDWLDSGRWFHVMRDHYSHTELMMPGMWGGVNGALPPVLKLLNGFAPELMTSGSVLSALLADRVWPTIRDSVCIHDRHHKAMRARQFPRLGDLPPGQFVGQLRHVEIPEEAVPASNTFVERRKHPREEAGEEITPLTYSQNDILI